MRRCRTRPSRSGLSILLTLGVLVGGCTLVEPADPPVSVSGAGAQLAELPVKGRAPKTGYTREQFGSAWTDDVTVEFGRNGCDTRNDILRRDLDAVTLDPSTQGCVVLEGTLTDPFSADVLAFRRGRDSSSDVQIDHVVPLSLAWQTGAQQLGEPTRRDFANDPLNLLAVDGTLNQQKSDSDAATWLPPSNGYRCEYVARVVAVKARYRLWVTPPERDAIARILSSCPGQPLTDDEMAEAPAVRAPAGDDASLPFANCAAARAAGAAPVRRGDPGYQGGLDRDANGVGCE